MRHIHIHRLPQYDYRSDGYYFVTIVSANRANIFSGREKIVTRIFRATVADIPGVAIDTMIVMPDHVHVIFKFNHATLPLGEVVRRCKSKVRIAIGKNGQFVWQPNYYEHVVRNEASLNRIREYIMLNPKMEKLAIFDRESP